VVAYAALRYTALYPPGSLAREPELSQQYKAFLGAAGVGLAVCPADQYPAAALWVMGDSIPLVLAFGVATLAARLALRDT